MLVLDLEPTVKRNVNQWLNGDYDEATKAEIRTLVEKGAVTELTDAFYKELEFGTGGLRGIMGAGSNRVNKYTLGMATQGLSNYLLKQYPDEQIKVAIAHDCRNNSDTFARMTAEVFSANGIYVYFFEGLRPTPELSFAIRELGCKSGVMLTASHNPKEYNG
ncbi:MAG: phospho-sugar mutase, partial [Bacteroidota bacterium]